MWAFGEKNTLPIRLGTDVREKMGVIPRTLVTSLAMAGGRRGEAGLGWSDKQSAGCEGANEELPKGHDLGRWSHRPRKETDLRSTAHRQRFPSLPVPTTTGGEAGWEGGAQRGIHIEPSKEPRCKSNEKAKHGSWINRSSQEPLRRRWSLKSDLWV